MWVANKHADNDNFINVRLAIMKLENQGPKAGERLTRLHQVKLILSNVYSLYIERNEEYQDLFES